MRKISAMAVLALFGTAVLVVKFTRPAWWPHVLWSAVTLLPVLLLAIRRGLQDRYSATDGAALLDGRLNAGGLLMSVAEKPNGRWRQSLPRDEAVWTEALPKLRPVRFARLVVLPLVFTIAALALPPRAERSDAAKPQRTVLPSIAALPENVELAKQAGLLEPDHHELLKESADRTVKDSRKFGPNAARTRVADNIGFTLFQRATTERRIIENGRRAIEKLNAAGKNGNPPLTREQKEQLQADVAAAMKRLRRLRKNARGKSSGKKPATTPGNAKTAAAQKSHPVRKSQSKTTKPPSGKTRSDKTKTQKVVKVSKTVSSKTAAGKTRHARSARGKSTAGKQRPSGKTPAKTAAGRKRKIPGIPDLKNITGLKNLSDLSKLVDLNTIMEMYQKLPPEMQQRLMQEAMRRLQSGEFQIPQDPAARRMLMEQARQLLKKEGTRLKELQQRFAKFANDPALRDQFLRKNDNENRSDSGTPGSGGSGANGKTGGGTGTAQRKLADAAAHLSFKDIVYPPGMLKTRRATSDGTIEKKESPVNPFQRSEHSNTNPGGASGNSKWRALKRNVRPRHRDLIYKYFYGKDGK